MKPLRTGIERSFGPVGENMYCMKQTNFYRGIENITVNAVEHDIVLTHDIVFDCIITGKRRPVCKLTY